MRIKRLSIMILVIFILITLGLPINVSGAGDFDVSHIFSSNPAEQGEYVTVTISITNNNPDQSRMYWLGVHFDWQAEDIYTICSDVSEENPKSIATGETESFGITFEIPSNVQTGTQVYDIRFDYELHDGWFGEWNDYTWNSETLTDFRVIEKKEPTNGGSSDGLSSDGSSGIIGGIELLIILGVIILIIVIGLIAWAISRKKESQQYPPPPPPFPSHPPLAQHPSRQYSPPPPKRTEGTEERVRWEDDEKTKISKFCPNCGVETMGKRFCSECGQELS